MLICACLFHDSEFRKLDSIVDCVCHIKIQQKNITHEINANKLFTSKMIKSDSFYIQNDPTMIVEPLGDILSIPIYKMVINEVWLQKIVSDLLSYFTCLFSNSFENMFFNIKNKDIYLLSTKYIFFYSDDILTVMYRNLLVPSKRTNQYKHFLNLIFTLTFKQDKTTKPFIQPCGKSCKLRKMNVRSNIKILKYDIFHKIYCQTKKTTQRIECIKSWLNGYFEF